MDGCRRATSVAGAARPTHQRLLQLTARPARQEPRSQPSSGQCGERDEEEPKRHRSGAVVSMGGGLAAPATLARPPQRPARARRVA